MGTICRIQLPGLIMNKEPFLADFLPPRDLFLKGEASFKELVKSVDLVKL